MFVGVLWLFCDSLGNAKSTKFKSKMPRFSWDTLPVSFHCSNSSAPIGMYNPESLEVLAKYSVVEIEKWQGMDGLFPDKDINWQNCQNGTDVSKCGCCTEDNIVSVGKAIKEIDPTTMVIGYHHTYIGYPNYRNGRLLAEKPDWWAKDENGEIIHWHGDGTWVYWDHSQMVASETWEQGCLDMTNTGHIDGCFFDGCLTSEKQKYNPQYMINKKASMIDAQTKMPGPCICGSGGDVLEGLAATQVQNWGKHLTWSEREIPMIMEAVAANVMFEAHGPCPEDANDQNIIDNVSAFLIGAGPYSYYQCGGHSGIVPIWYPIYDMPLGEPLSDAILGDDGVWRREFKTGTKVTFDTKAEKGTIDWASE